MSFLILAAAATLASAPAPQPAPQKGYEAQVTASGLLCLRPTTTAEAARLNITPRHQECRPMTRWEDEGLTIRRVAKV